MRYSELYKRKPNPHCTQEYDFILDIIRVHVLGTEKISALENMLSEGGDIKCSLAKTRLVATWFLSSNMCLRKLVANMSYVFLGDEIWSCE